MGSLRVWRWVVGLALGMVVCVGAQDVTVRKEVVRENPTAALGRFEGPAALGTRLREVLERCGWFRVVESGSGAQYVISARAEGSEGSWRLGISVSAGGQRVASTSVQAADADRLMFRGVDAVIEGVFRVPGPCSGRIAFAVGGQGQRKEIYLVHFDGSGLQRLTHNGSISTEPSWGPKGRMLVYTLYRNHATSVVLLDTVLSRQRRLSQFSGLNAGASLSPDGAWAVLSLSVERRIDLYLLALAGGTRRQVTQDHAVESSACWSPSGGTLCYVSDKVGNPQLYLCPASGGSSVRLVRNYEEAVSPDWSSTSNKVCFSTRLGRQYVLAVVDMSDPARRREVVVDAAGDWESPSWAPDGRHVVCARRVKGTRSLYMVDTWHGRFVPITRGGDHSLPSWSVGSDR